MECRGRLRRLATTTAVAFGLLAGASGGVAEPAGAASPWATRSATSLTGLRVKLARVPAKNLWHRRTTRAAPAAPDTVSGSQSRVGFSGSVVWYEAEEQLAFLRRARATGVTWVREDFHWGAFERRPGDWNWTVGDRLMRNASLAGISVLGVLAYSANWASSGSSIYHPPRNPAEYAEFCRRIVQRYGPGGTFWRANPELSSRPLTALEIWNEPWQNGFWRPNPDPAAYARLVRAAATAIHAENPSVKVLASGDVFQMRSDTRDSLDWFRLLLQADPDLFKKHVDAYSVHLYVQDRSPLDTRAQQRWRFDRWQITRELATKAGAPHPLWVTEFGWTTSRSHPDAVSEETQARFVREGFERLLGEWRGSVERSFLYHWGRPESDDAGGFGPLRPDGSTKPVLGALSLLLQSA